MSRLQPPVDRRDHYRGDLSAPVTLVEFGDYECPYCGQAYGVVRALENTFAGQLCSVFRNFPLADMHPHALLAAKAAEAAGFQSMFWPMHDLIYEHQHALDAPYLRQYALALGLDVPRLERDMRSPVVLEKIRSDVRTGAISGVNGTPTFFLDGLRHDGPFDYDTLSGAIRDLLIDRQAVGPTF